jgi:uncharacterized protein (DUF488 family)
MDNLIIYTIGHSTHPIEYFAELLEKYSVNCLIDVRSVAASSYNPQYNKEPLSNFLQKRSIIYMHFSEQFGARHADPDLLNEEGKVDFEKVRRSYAFKSGVEKLWMDAEKGNVIALMCSEGEPLDCHRFSMISVALKNEGFDVRHILKDKSCRSNYELETLLLKKYDKKLPKPDMFQPDITLEDQLRAAYQLKNNEIGFSPYSRQRQEEENL